MDGECNIKIIPNRAFFSIQIRFPTRSTLKYTWLDVFI